jgi:SP family sugar:H+ symporter-like MFS transporter
VPLDGFGTMLCCEHSDDDNNKSGRIVCWALTYRSCEWVVYDLLATIHSGGSHRYRITQDHILTVPKESAPARYRGLLISVFQIWTSIGSLVGTVIDNATHDMNGRNSYIIPLATIFIVPAILSFGLLFIPESPRWLMLVEKQEKASKAMLWLRPDPATVPEELAEIQAAIDAEKATKHTANFMDIWRDPVDRRRTLLSIAAISTQAASGAMFMIAYGTYFFQMAHVGSPFMNTCILTAVGVLAVIVNSCVISKIGRRRVFLMTGLSICGVCQIIIAAVYHVNPGTVSTGKVSVPFPINN